VSGVLATNSAGNSSVCFDGNLTYDAGASRLTIAIGSPGSFSGEFFFNITLWDYPDGLDFAWPPNSQTVSDGSSFSNDWNGFSVTDLEPEYLYVVRTNYYSTFSIQGSVGNLTSALGGVNILLTIGEAERELTVVSAASTLLVSGTIITAGWIGGFIMGLFLVPIVRRAWIARVRIVSGPSQ
jgi:hypothetical protein